MANPAPSPDYLKQPVLVVEVPREFIHPHTSKRFLSQTSTKMQMKDKISPSRWAYIAQFLIVYTKSEQVRIPVSVYSQPTKGSL